VNKYEHR